MKRFDLERPIGSIGKYWTVARGLTVISYESRRGSS